MEHLFSATTWKPFRMAEVFTFSKGKRLTKDNMIEGKTNYIGAISDDNGVRQYISEEPTHQGNCITVNYNGSVGEAFYQEQPFWASDDVNVLKLKDHILNRNIALFLCTLIKHNKFKFSYGRKWTLEKMKESILMLPVCEENNVDFTFMDYYIGKIIEVRNLDNKIKTDIQHKTLGLDNSNWKEFSLIDFFDMFAGKYINKLDYEQGLVPYVSTSDTDNGVMSFVNISPKFPQNCITIGKVGVTTYYQNQPFLATSDVTILVPKYNFLNKYIGLFISTLIKQESKKWTYGRQIRLGDCKQLKIKFPVVDSQPNWIYMENFIKQLPYSDKI